jgi:hypothetical protein
VQWKGTLKWLDVFASLTAILEAPSIVIQISYKISETLKRRLQEHTYTRTQYLAHWLFHLKQAVFKFLHGLRYLLRTELWWLKKLDVRYLCLNGKNKYKKADTFSVAQGCFRCAMAMSFIVLQLHNRFLTGIRIISLL